MNIAHFNTNADSDWQKEALVCGKECFVRGAVCANKGGAGLWFWICDSPSVAAKKPSCAPVFVPANSTLSIDWQLSPRKFTSGIYVCVSTDPVTKTLPATGDAYFEVCYGVI